MMDGRQARLTPFAERHLDRSLQWFNDEELARLLDRVNRVTPEQHRAWFAGLAARSDLAYFAIEKVSSGEHIGNIWLADIDRRNQKAELRIVIGEDTGRDRGIGSEAISLLSSHAERDLGLHRIYSHVLAINPRAKRAFEKAGFSVEGILKDDRRTTAGEYVDCYLLGRLATIADTHAIVPQTTLARGASI
jgi:RimJ/RimL family protein N-acetyltransferase